MTKKTHPFAPGSLFDLDLNHQYLHFRRTKIVATIGPATDSPVMIRKLIEAGMNVARINFSHGKAEDHVVVMHRIRSVAVSMKRTVAILADLCGPKIRVGKFAEGAVELKDGSTVTVTIAPVLGSATLIPSQYRRLIKDVSIGDPLLLDDGNLELKVIGKSSSTALQAMVIRGGTLRNNKGMNLPGSLLAVNALTVKDRSDLGHAVAGGADFIALSFVRKSADIRQLRSELKRLKADIPIIAKIEKPEALTCIQEIVACADGIMVARGDLGVEMPAKKVPIIQNKLIQIANHANKPVIVATQMLESMIEHGRPTRAEVTDVANACENGADAVMLSGETAVGKFPIEAVSMMDSILRETEAYQFFAHQGTFPCSGMSENNRLHDALGTAAAQLSRDLMARAVFVLTRSGYTARIISADRPAAPILAFTQNPAIERQLNLFWGVYPFPIAPDIKFSAYVNRAQRLITTLKLAKPDDYILLLSGLGDKAKVTNSIVVHRIT